MHSKKQLKVAQIIGFLKQKDYEFKKEIGQGGLGRTVLLRDPIVDLDFICKKYSPEAGIGDVYFPNFIQEIRVLHLMYHKNIVRIFNYYLYPEQKTGYILMEYIEGDHIDKYILENPDKINEIFHQLINGFTYLEENNIVHRDIRPANILVSNDTIAKIIDFGFGKRIETPTDVGKSISLNWRYDPPTDFSEGEYTHATDIYFLGKLFEEIIRSNADASTFIYMDILRKMIKPNKKDRYDRFMDIQNDIISSESIVSDFELNFSQEDKEVYQSFAYELLNSLASISSDITYISDIEDVYKNLCKVHKSSILENHIYDMSGLINIFIVGDWRYYPKKRMEISTLGNFIKLLKLSGKEGQRIILDHLRVRISEVDKVKITDELTIEDIPF